MRHLFSRRRFLSTTSIALPLAHMSGFQQGEGSSAAVPDTFPQQPAAMVRDAVAASHGNVKRIRELVDAHPALARAAYDWGFGDWEDCLGAASHVGNREIAEYLDLEGREADALLGDDARSARHGEGVHRGAAGSAAHSRTAQHQPAGACKSWRRRRRGRPHAILKASATPAVRKRNRFQTKRRRRWPASTCSGAARPTASRSSWTEGR